LALQDKFAVTTGRFGGQRPHRLRAWKRPHDRHNPHGNAGTMPPTHAKIFSAFQRGFLKSPVSRREQSGGSRQACSSSLRKNVHSLANSVPALENMLPSAFCERSAREFLVQQIFMGNG
jgi:hypothetical protein